MDTLAALESGCSSGVWGSRGAVAESVFLAQMRYLYRMSRVFSGSRWSSSRTISRKAIARSMACSGLPNCLSEKYRASVVPWRLMATLQPWKLVNSYVKRVIWRKFMAVIILCVFLVAYYLPVQVVDVSRTHCMRIC